jgi:peptide chain release factor 2
MKFGGVFDSEQFEHEIGELEQKTLEQSFWDNREKAEKVLQEISSLKKRYEPWKELKQQFNDLEGMFELAQAEGEDSLEGEISEGAEDLTRKFEKLRVLELLGEEFDDKPAFLTIHSGAGGTEACDWVSMLLRMYTRWSETKEYRIETVDFLEAEGGIKSVTLEISGSFVFGYLKGETGIHRLVRISPFDSGARRHTSFASVYVSPVVDDDIEIDIQPEELRIDTYRAQGAGGQHVNKTDSAVRITHLETGIVVQCQNERSQHKNKATAMKVLRSRLYDYYKKQQEDEHEKKLEDKKDISWGNQIRSYVFQPYTMVKDHRTKKETGNVGAVMDGNLDPFIEEYLKWNWENSQ